MPGYASPLDPTWKPGAGEPPRVEYWEDFMGAENWALVGTNFALYWVVSETSGAEPIGDIIADVVDGVGGIVALTSPFAVDGATVMRAGIEQFRFVQGKPCSFMAGVKVTTDEADCTVHLGLSTQDANPFTSLPSNTASFKLVPRLSATDTTMAIQTSSKISASDEVFRDVPETLAVARIDQFHHYAIEWNGQGTVEWYFDGVRVGRAQKTDEIPTGVALAPNFAVRSPGSGATKTIHIDYVGVVMER